MNIGSVYVEMMADLAPWRKAASNLKNEATSLVTEVGAEVGRKMGDAFKGLGETGAKAFKGLASSAGEYTKGIGKARDETGRFVSESQSKGSSLLQMFSRLGSGLTAAFASGRKEAVKDLGDIEKAAASVTNRFSGLRDMLRGVFQGAGMAAFNAAMSAAGGVVRGFGEALFGLNNEAEAAQAKINAFTKNASLTADILAKVRQEASTTPFAFQEMANATAALMPVAKQAGLAWEDLLKQAEILAASNPLEGLEGASFSLREAMTGDFTSIIERFNLSRQSINKWKEEGVDNMEIVRRAMAEMGYDSDLVAAMGQTMAGRWSTFLDTLDGFKISLTKPTFDFLKEVLGDLQGNLDRNTEKWTAFASAAGEKLAAGLRFGYEAIKETIHFIELLRGVLDGTEESGQRLGKASWADRLAGRIGALLATVRGTLQQLSDAMHGFFRGGTGGAFDEDSPLIVGLMRANNLANDAASAFDRLAQKASGVKMPDQLGGGTLGGALGDTLGKVDFGAVGLGAGAAGAAAGAVALLPALTHLLPAISPLMSVLPVLGSMLGALISPLGLLAAGVAVLAVAWSQNWFDIQGKTEAAVGAVKGYLETNLPAAMDTAKSYFNDTIVPGFSAAWDSFTALAATGTARFRDYWSNDLMPQLAALGETVGPALSQMGDAISRTFDALLPYAQAFVESIGNLGASVLPILAEVGGYIVDSFGPAISGVIGFLTETIPLIADAFDNVLRLVTPILQGILSIVTTVYNAIAGFIRENSDTIVSVLKGAWDIISGVVKVAWDLIAGIIQTGLLLLSGNWRGAWDEIKQTFSNVWDGIKQIASGAWDILKGIFSLGLEAIKDLWGKAWEWASQKFGEISDGIARKLDEWSTGLKNKLDSAAEGIKSAILRPWEAARDAIGGIVEAFVSRFKGPLQTGLNAMGKFGGGVAGVINWIANALHADFRVEAPVVPQLAKGTRDWGGGWAWVGEGPGGAGAELAYLPRGAVVVPHKQSRMMAERLGIPAPTSGAGGGLPGFALGLNLPSLLDIIKGGPEWLMNQALSAMGIKSGPELPGIMGNAASAVLGRVKEWIAAWVTTFIKRALPVAPGDIQNAIKFAESQVGLPYIWGGGHGGAGGPGVGWDCSGFVAAVLDAAGIKNPHGIVTAFYEWMENGRTGVIDIGVSNPYAEPDVQHTGIGLMGQWYESGGRAGGAGRTADYFPIVGHPPGFSPEARASGPWTANAWRKVDVTKSLENMARGEEGQWSRGLVKMAGGGVITEPVTGVGLHSGIQYLIGEVGKELVLNPQQLERLYQYFFLALTTGRTSNSLLSEFPLEMRPLLMRAAEAYLARLGLTGSGIPGQVGPPQMPNTTGLNNNPAGLPDTTGLNDGGARYPADQQIYYAETYGAFYPGELQEDDPRIVAAIARFRRKAAGLPDTTGLNDSAPTLPPPADAGVPDAPATSAGTGGGRGGSATIALTLTNRFEMPDGQVIVQTIVTDPIALDDLAEGVTEVQAREISKRSEPGGRLGVPPKVPDGPIGPGLDSF